MRSRANQERTIRSPDRIGYSVRYHAGMHTSGVNIGLLF